MNRFNRHDSDNKALRDVNLWHLKAMEQMDNVNERWFRSYKNYSLEDDQCPTLTPIYNHPSEGVRLVLNGKTVRTYPSVPSFLTTRDDIDIILNKTLTYC